MNKKVWFILFLATLLFSSVLNVYATEKYGFVTVPLSPEEKETIHENIDIKQINVTSLSEIESPIINFDVSESENLLLGLENKKVLILSNNGEILKCFSFNTSGSFYVKWEKDNILLMLVRGDIIIELTTDGEIIDIIETDTSNVNNNKLWRNTQNNEIKVNDNLYIARNQMGVFNFFSSTYSQIVKINNSEETTIFDVNESQLIKNVGLAIFFLLMFTIIPLIVFYTNKEQTQFNKSQIYSENKTV